MSYNESGRRNTSPQGQKRASTNQVILSCEVHGSGGGSVSVKCSVHRTAYYVVIVSKLCTCTWAKRAGRLPVRPKSLSRGDLDLRRATGTTTRRDPRQGLDIAEGPNKEGHMSELDESCGDGEQTIFARVGGKLNRPTSGLGEIRRYRPLSEMTSETVLCLQKLA
ncbi:hypothetical protein LX36DRAFT_408329 [Colletotrichum falcatum]|nr:hypothetical protein LX36DRAFT_408329 [Colletotrichum falcatum]